MRRRGAARVAPLAAALVGALVAVGSTPAQARRSDDGSRTVAKNACALLTTEEIESVLTAAPLDPGPRLRRLPNTKRTLTNCAWDDELARDETQLAVFTGLIRKARPRELRELGVASADSGARDLTPDELDGIGERGSVEILRDGTYGNVAIVDGRTAFFVSAQYQGAAPLPQVTEAEMITLARLAAARLTATG